MTAVIYFGPDQALAKVEDNRKNKAVIEALQVTGPFSNTFSDGMKYLRFGLNKRSRHKNCLREKPFVAIDENSGSAQQRVYVAILFFEALNVTNQFPQPNPPTELLKIDQRINQLLGFGHLDFIRCTHIRFYHLYSHIRSDYP